MTMNVVSKAWRMVALAVLAVLAVTGVAPAIAQTSPAPAVQSAPAPAPAEPAASPATTDNGYVLGTGDVIEVMVVGREDYRARVRVQNDGSVQLPLIGGMTATGKTVLQLGVEVRDALKKGGYYAAPVVSVDIASYASRYVTVLGEVNNPGLVPIDRSYRVSEILARVGGLKDSGADTLSLRRASGEEQSLNIRTLATGGPDEDPVVNPGDKLYVPQVKTFYIYGQVAAPGVYRVDADMSMRKALARGGGLTPSGSEKRIKVFRDGQEIKKVDLNAPISPGDTIVVGERLF